MWIKIILSLALFIAVLGQQQGKKNPCLAHDECGSCLRAAGDCAFCKDTKFTDGENSGRARCDFADNLRTLGCKSIMDVQHQYNKLEEKAFDSTIQISPQRIQLKLRPDKTEKIKISVKPAKDFPVDLYYLMDMSKSMEDDLEELRTLGTKIADEIGKITPHYKLAFGSFVDKTVAPFIQPSKLQKPCTLDDKITSCVPTFGYKHVLDFTSDKEEFQNQITAQKISGNLDTPEGGFDALMQVTACNSTLKWRPIEKAHRIVVFVTDASPHIAGDGKLGGIITPNDGQCHLAPATNPKFYTKLNDVDYPSVSKLKESLKSNGIIPIFAVTSGVQDIYQKFGAEWTDLNAAVGTLLGDSSNIVTLIREKYSEIIKTIRMSDNSPKDIVVKYKVDSSCEIPSKNNDFCKEVVAGTEYGFDVSITAVSCPADKTEWGKKQQFTINAPGLGKVEVEVEVICECECEKSGTPDAAECNTNGTFKCGICYCNEGRFGELCQCDAQNQADDSLCKQVNATNTDAVCSSAGSCVCGKCECNKRQNKGELISGKYCECNNYGCNRFNGLLCGGPDRGECDCGNCKCKEAFIGENCGSKNCELGKKKCLDTNGLVCSGHGTCSCDTCDCDKGYGGKLCQECVSCPSKCSKFKDCVQCVVWKEGPLSEDGECNDAECKALNIHVVNETSTVCEYKDSNNCFFHFNFYKDPSGNETILVQKSKRCVTILVTPTPVLAIVLGIIGGLILLALILLLLWKLLITAYDNYEYQKFLKENSNPNWANTNNPIYKPSQTNYQNPTYAGKS